LSAPQKAVESGSKSTRKSATGHHLLWAVADFNNRRALAAVDVREPPAGSGQRAGGVHIRSGFAYPASALKVFFLGLVWGEKTGIVQDKRVTNRGG